MFEWQRLTQAVIEEIDISIKNGDVEALTLQALAARLDYSEFYLTRKFKEISGLRLRDYLRQRKLAFALKEVRDTERSLLEIACAYGFSSNEAFGRAFKDLYGLTPSEYRRKPQPLVLRTKLTVFDRYFFGLGEIGMLKSSGEVKVYLVTIPAHKFLHIRNYESNGYWDFWQRQNALPGQDYDTICGLLDSVKGKLDDLGGTEANCGAGQIMAYINDPTGRLCDWGIPRIECWGARLPADWSGVVPAPLQLFEVPEGEYIVFEHGPFDYEQEMRSLEVKIEAAMQNFDYHRAGCCLDTRPGRIMYFYYNPELYFKYVRPVRRLNSV